MFVVTFPGTRTRRYFVQDENDFPASKDYSCVWDVRDQNVLRHLFAILNRYRVAGPRSPTYADEGLAVTWDSQRKTFRLYARTHNHEGYASFLAGILTAHLQRERKTKRTRVS